MSSMKFEWARHKERISLPSSFSRSHKQDQSAQLFTKLKESKKYAHQNCNPHPNIFVENIQQEKKRLIKLRDQKVAFVVRECLISGRDVSEVMASDVIPLLYCEVRNVFLGETEKIQQPIKTKTLESTCIGIQGNEYGYLHESRKAHNKKNLTIDTSAQSTITKLYSPLQSKQEEIGKVNPRQFTLGNNENSEEKSGNLEFGEEFSFNLRNSQETKVREFCEKEINIGEQKKVNKTYEMLKNDCFNNKMLGFSRTNVAKGKKIKEKVMGNSQTFQYQ